MDIKNFEIQLAKLNSLYTAFSKDQNINDIERDLLKSYIQKMYECLHGDQHSNDQVAEASAPVKEVPKIEKKVEKAKKAPVAEKIVIEQPEEIVEVAQDEIIEEEIIEVVEAEVKEVELKPELVLEAAMPTPKVASIAIKPEMKELFADFSNNELGDKLSQMPIKDLTKALGINEKIFTIKELFGGDSDKFRQTLKEINGLGSFDEAKLHLMNGAAAEFGWSDENKTKKARNFIKTIKRRFN